MTIVITNSMMIAFFIGFTIGYAAAMIYVAIRLPKMVKDSFDRRREL